MHSMPTRWLALAGAALFAACAQPNGDINKVQPNVTKKADLLGGQWYFRNTVNWTPSTTGFTFAGETGNLEKIVFEIQEKTLVGYRAYPYILGAESKVDLSSKPSGTTSGGQVYYGSPLVAYPIQSQFDIQRNYNAATGETGNVISENASDRPWNQREYIRVDWSASLINKDSGMGWNTMGNAAGASDITAWIQPNEPGSDPYDWPVQEFGADGKLKYFDFTGRYYAQPGTFTDEETGEVYPQCYGSYRYDCAPAEIRIRTSLSKIDPDVTNDYEPLVYDNDLETKFGFFRTERLNYDRKFGYIDTARIYLANRHRTWEHSFEKDANGHPDASKVIPFANRTHRVLRHPGDAHVGPRHLQAVPRDRPHPRDALGQGLPPRHRRRPGQEPGRRAADDGGLREPGAREGHLDWRRAEPGLRQARPVSEDGRPALQLPLHRDRPGAERPARLRPVVGRPRDRRDHLGERQHLLGRRRQPGPVPARRDGHPDGRQVDRRAGHRPRREGLHGAQPGLRQARPVRDLGRPAAGRAAGHSADR
jgi:hypothetical protein